MAGGCELALHCDIRIGSPSARFIMPLARLGLVLPCEPAERLMSIAGASTASDMLFTGDAVDGVRAQSAGLLTRLVEDAQLAAQTETIVRQIASNAPLSLRAMKRLLNSIGTTLPDEDRERFDVERLAISRSEDMREGLRAFFERRSPIFRGV